MTTLTSLDPATIAARLRDGTITLVDIREPDEYAREHIAEAVSIPLSRFEQAHLNLAPLGEVVFHCKSGRRTEANCARLAARVEGQAYVMAGGLNAWKQAGLQLHTDAKAPLELNRQVQITVGSLMLLGVALAVFANPYFVALPAALGAGLLFAGLSGWCGMAHALAIAPWNKRAAP